MSKLPETVVLNKKNLKILTPNGYETFLGVNKITKPQYVHLKFSNGKELKCSEDHPILTIDGIVKAKNLDKKTEISTKNGGCFVVSKRNIKKQIFLYDIVNSGKDHLYYSNDIVSHNCEFLGSSNTLIDGKKLQQLTYRTPLFTSGGVDVYENPEKNKKYITVVDTSRGVDIDYSAFIVFDVTQVPYNIVAKFRANDISPLLYPNIIHQVSTHYNNALALIETNDIGQQVADILHMDLEYDGVIVTQTKGRAGQKIGGGFGSGGGKSKPQFGVRTTRQVKRIGCGNFKTLVESDKLIVNDYDLLYEMARFIENKASYEAEEGHHDDLVMCCIHGSNMIETEDGQKTMRWVVENKYTGKVLSLNAAGEFEWKSVIGHSAKENSGKNKKTWITLGEAASGRKRLICTTDHKCATVSDIFNPEIEYLEADKLDGKYIVKFPNTKKHGFQTLNPSYNKDQVSVILGIQLGDGHINRKGKFSTAHGEKQNEYSRYIQSILGGNLTYNKKNQSRLEFNTTEQTHKLRELMYIDGKKTIKNIYKMIDEISLAFWYMDDGHLKLSKGCINYSVELCTDSFSYEDHLLLKEVLFEKFNINSSIINIKKSPMQYRLRIGTESSKTFFDLIAPYVCKNMEYKIPENYRTIELKPINNSYLDYSIVKANVFYRNQMGLESKLYDIEVEGNHNFVVNNTLVHNCVLFAWLVNQSYFKELTDTDVRSNLVQDNNALLDDDMLPFGMMDFGDDEHAEWKADPFYDLDFGPHKDYF